MPEPAISVRNVSKAYRMYGTPSDRLKELIWPRRKRHRNFQALKDVSFDLPAGETLGIVGRNGSGKSTLLQIICGTLQPSSGDVNVRGRIAALLELGAGFNGEFTGRENVYLNATILGMSRAEIDARFDSIAEFAGLGDFIDQSVKTYSSGMFVRLAFAVAINSDPDILIVDEALSVGDEAFQRKCFARIEQIQARGATVLFVSHAPGSVLQLCSKAILLDGGEKLLEGSPKDVIGQYQRLMNATGEAEAIIRREILSLDTGETVAPDPAAVAANAVEVAPLTEDEAPHPDFTPDFTSQSRVEYDEEGARIENMRIVDEQGRQVNQLHMGRNYTLHYDVSFSRPATDVGFGMLIKSVGGTEIAGGTTSRSAARRLDAVSPGQRAHAAFPFECRFVSGTYFVNAGVTREDPIEGMVFMHRVLDGLIFRVPPRADDVFATGMVDVLSAPPRINMAPSDKRGR
jgi:lipopolysaccharide transport system ATP-binding protein